MFEFVISVVTDRTDHPFLFGLFVIAGLFVVAGVLTEFAIGNGVAAGFMIIYAILATILGLAGYAVLYALRFSAVIQTRYA